MRMTMEVEIGGIHGRFVGASGGDQRHTLSTVKPGNMSSRVGRAARRSSSARR
jgi:hypothetical protein